MKKLNLNDIFHNTDHVTVGDLQDLVEELGEYVWVNADRVTIEVPDDFNEKNGIREVTWALEDMENYDTKHTVTMS